MILMLAQNLTAGDRTIEAISHNGAAPARDCSKRLSDPVDLLKPVGAGGPDQQRLAL